jgi:hypothetical protein
MSLTEKNQAYKDYMGQRLDNQIDAYGNPLNQGDDGPDNTILFPQNITPGNNTDDTEEEDVGLRLAFRANGGRIGLQEGGGIEQRLEQLGGDVSSAEQLLQGINQRLKTAESSLGSGGGGLGGGLGSIALPGVGPNVGNEIAVPSISGTPTFTPLSGVGSTASAIFSSDPLSNIPLPGSPGVPDLNKFNEIKDIFMGNMSPGKPGSLIPLEENPNFQNVPEQFRSGFANYLKENPNSFGFGGQAFSSVGLPGGGSVTFGNTGSAGAFRDYLKSTGFNPPSPLGQPLQSSLGSIENMQNQTPSLAELYPNAGQTKLDNPLPLRGGAELMRLAGIPMQSQGTSGVPALGFADGGRIGAAEGGIMDLETGRQMYFLGKLVKKATKAVKKVVKSPIGKAALIAGLGYGLGGGTFFGKMLPGVTRGGQGFGGFGGLSAIFGNVGDIIGGSTLGDKFAKAAGSKIGLGITAASVLAGLLTPQQEEEAQQLADNTGFSIEEARNAILQAAKENYAMDVRARGFKADGGIMRAGYQEGSKEPVAKKTMPLLDMGGKEMDLREDGGFVPIGRMEKADDVPARLSKNEFVFTADAVRNAGDGNVDKGAEVMYNMMKNLESGGDVSEESQGLEGARKMFQTSQRLEEVI